MLRGNRGFTLIEVLVALALLVILSGALYGTFFSVTKARERGAERMDVRRELSSTLALVRSELASTYFKSGSKYGTNALSEFVVEDRDTFGKPSSLLQFTALASPRVDTPPSSDLIAVRYLVKEKEGGGLTLTREAKDRYLSTKSLPYPVMDDLEGFLVECYDGAKWVKSWDTQLNTRLPDCVRVTVTLKGGEKYSVLATPGITRKSTPSGFPDVLKSLLGKGLPGLSNLPGLSLPGAVPP